MKHLFIILGLSSLVCANIISSTNTLIDTSTRLEWQNQTINKDMDKTWRESLEYCRDLVLDDKDDWRLPNILELDSLVDDTRIANSNILILEEFEETTGDITDNEYWSSTSIHYGTDEDFDGAFYLNFHKGTIVKTYKTHEILSPRQYNVRCVRDYKE